MAKEMSKKRQGNSQEMARICPRKYEEKAKKKARGKTTRKVRERQGNNKEKTRKRQRKYKETTKTQDKELTKKPPTSATGDWVDSREKARKHP